MVAVAQPELKADQTLNHRGGPVVPPPRRISARVPGWGKRGLPTEKNRRLLAHTYLTEQAKLWPEMVERGIIPAATPEAVQRYADAFEMQFFAGRVDTIVVDVDLPLGASYLRYSRIHQNARSLDQQLVLQLRRAKNEGIWIPWALVLADAGVTGTVRRNTT